MPFDLCLFVQALVSASSKRYAETLVPTETTPESAVRERRRASKSVSERSKRRRASRRRRSLRTTSLSARWIVSVVCFVSRTALASSTRTRSRLIEVRFVIAYALSTVVYAYCWLTIGHTLAPATYIRKASFTESQQRS